MYYLVACPQSLSCMSSADKSKTGDANELEKVGIHTVLCFLDPCRNASEIAFSHKLDKVDVSLTILQLLALIL